MSSTKIPMCMRCNKLSASHMSDPCECFQVCEACAMKMATGGRCKSCRNMYGAFKAITLSAISDANEEGAAEVDMDTTAAAAADIVGYKAIEKS